MLPSGTQEQPLDVVRREVLDRRTGGYHLSLVTCDLKLVGWGLAG